MTQMQTKFKQTEIGLIPEDWELVELGKIGDITKLSGFEFTKSMNYIDNGTIIALRALNIKNGYLDLSDIKLISKDVSNSLIRSKLFEGDILLTYTGTVGEVAMVDENDKYHLAPNVCRFRSNNVENNYYIFQYMKSNYFKSNMQNFGVGSTQPTIPMKTIRLLKLPLPPLPEQKVIAEILSSLDDKIELLEKQNKTLENIGQALFKSWFVDFEGFENDLVESEMGMIPRGWKIGKVGDLVEKIESGDWGKENIEGNFKNKVFCIRGTDIYELKKGLNGKMPIRFILDKKLDEKKLENNDIIIEISGGSPTQSTGRSLYITNDLLKRFDNNLICSNFCKVIKPKKHYSLFLNEFLDFFYNSGGFFQFENGTTGIKNLDVSNFISKYDLIIPNINNLEKFNKILTESKNKIQINGLQIQTLSNLRDSLLPRLMSGKIRVV